MPKSPSKSTKAKSQAPKIVKDRLTRAAAKSAPPTAKQVAKTASGNGNRASQPTQLELDTSDATNETPAPSRTSNETATPSAAASVAAPTMKELGLSAKDAWKIDLRGKRVALDEKGWREELVRALGRVPAKG